MANEATLNTGTTLNLETSGASLSDTDFHECNDDTRTSTDNAGFPLGIFKFQTAAGGFSAAPTAGAVINVYEQKTDGTDDSPDVDSSHKHDPLVSWAVDPADAQQTFYSRPVPICVLGGKYWVEWVDGGSGTASVDSGWTLDLTPCTYGTGGSV